VFRWFEGDARRLAVTNPLLVLPTCNPFCSSACLPALQQATEHSTLIITVKKAARSLANTSAICVQGDGSGARDRDPARRFYLAPVGHCCDTTRAHDPSDIHEYQTWASTSKDYWGGRACVHGAADSAEAIKASASS